MLVNLIPRKFFSSSLQIVVLNFSRLLTQIANKLKILQIKNE